MRKEGRTGIYRSFDVFLSKLLQAQCERNGRSFPKDGIGVVEKLPVAVALFEIESILRLCDDKLTGHKFRCDGLRSFFSTFLCELMTTHIRAHDVDVSELGLETEDEEAYGGEHGKKAGALS